MTNNPKFKLKQIVTGKITGDGECGRFLTDGGKLMYIEEIFISEDYKTFEEAFKHRYRQKNPIWRNHDEAAPRVRITVNVEIEVLEDD